MSDLTKRQIVALKLLAGRRYATPADIGDALTVGRIRPLKAQGAGRLGGTMGTRLVRLGLAEHANSLRNGFPAYAISAKGRLALAGLIATGAR